MFKVEAIPVTIKGRTGYDIRVHDSGATIQDYLDALNRFIEAGTCFRTRAPGRESCYACSLCCQERIPVTEIDALNLRTGDVLRAVRELFHVYVEDKVVDITMKLNDSGCCVQLDQVKGICSNYLDRPLVCQTYICCPAARAAKQLREEIVNAGEDELVRSWFRYGKKEGGYLIHEAVNPGPDPLDYPETPFYRKTGYNQVRIKDVCSKKLWKQIHVL